MFLFSWLLTQNNKHKKHTQQEVSKVNARRYANIKLTANKQEKKNMIRVPPLGEGIEFNLSSSTVDSLFCKQILAPRGERKEG